MPTYEYKCNNCNHVEEISHKMNENRAQICVGCFQKGKHSEMIKGVGGGTAVHFKGTGFYETDYKGK